MKRTLTIALALAAAALLLGAGQASATRARTAPTPVTVVMHDPGCHWFSVDGALSRTMTVKGPALLANFDMATLEITGGRFGMVKANVGHRVMLSPGTYKIVMVGQARDDNVLTLLVK
ncbi:MAG TPA: hypothetical protein VJQ85_02505 [Gaiellaceae bacterium]|nr:hypothetical protein [Gaiellaceae bacterium]